MGNNKFENFVFSFLVCFMMVIAMTLYTQIWQYGTKLNFIGIFISFQFLAILTVAFLIDWFIVAPLVKSVIGKFTSRKTSFLKKILLISLSMVLCMCAAMSLLATLLHGGYDNLFWSRYLSTFAYNISFALPLQLILVGPIARQLFFMIFPPKALV